MGNKMHFMIPQTPTGLACQNHSKLKQSAAGNLSPTKSLKLNLIVALEIWPNRLTFNQADETQAGIKRIPLRMPDSLTGHFYSVPPSLLVKSSLPFEL